MLAQADGKLVAVGKPNTRVTPDDVVVKIERAPVLVASFKSAANASIGAAVLLKTKDGATVSCRVVDIDNGAAKIACAATAAKADVEVTFGGLDPAGPAKEPAKGEEIEMEEGSGSTGSAAPAKPAPKAAGSAG
jgi:hypothetical protein